MNPETKALTMWIKTMIKIPEAIIHAQVCEYIKLQYPDVIFTSEASGLRLTIGQAKKMKNLRSSAGLPDLWIAEPRGIYKALFIELKSEGILKKNLTYKTEHIADQAKVLDRLVRKGYFAVFGIGFDHAKLYIDWYMKLELK